MSTTNTNSENAQERPAVMSEDQAREIANRHYEELGYSRPEFLSASTVVKGGELIYRFKQVGRFNPGNPRTISVRASDGVVFSDLKPLPPKA